VKGTFIARSGTITIMVIIWGSFCKFFCAIFFNIPKHLPCPYSVRKSTFGSSLDAKCLNQIHLGSIACDGPFRRGFGFLELKVNPSIDSITIFSKFFVKATADQVGFSSGEHFYGYAENGIVSELKAYGCEDPR